MHHSHGAPALRCQFAGALAPSAKSSTFSPWSMQFHPFASPPLAATSAAGPPLEQNPAWFPAKSSFSTNILNAPTFFLTSRRHETKTNIRIMASQICSRNEPWILKQSIEWQWLHCSSGEPNWVNNVNGTYPIARLSSARLGMRPGPAPQLAKRQEARTECAHIAHLTSWRGHQRETARCLPARPSSLGMICCFAMLGELEVCHDE